MRNFEIKSPNMAIKIVHKSKMRKHVHSIVHLRVDENNLVVYFFENGSDDPANLIDDANRPVAAHN